MRKVRVRHRIAQADGNEDGVVDYVVWRRAMGMAGSGGLANVPEPGSAGLFVVAVGVVVALRGRK